MKLIVKLSKGFVMRLYILLITFLTSATLFAETLVTPSERVKDYLNVRSTPSTLLPAIGKFNKGDTAPLVSDETPNWYKIKFKGQSAFVSKSWTVLKETSDGKYTIDVIDVGTGLSIFVKGPDFSMLYDAGSNDDKSKGEDNRVLAFLAEYNPDLTKINHVILSHPHTDHVELMPDIFRNYKVDEAWDSGAINDICGYRDFIEQISDNKVKYHTARHQAGNDIVSFKKEGRCYGKEKTRFDFPLKFAAQITTDKVIALGQNASMQFLYANGDKLHSYNDNSLVVSLTLGDKKVLIMGDAESGSRNGWLSNSSPETSSVEAQLIDCCSIDLAADILVVGHHGSFTSSRRDFLGVVDAEHFVVSSGPKTYGKNKVTLPDEDVITELEKRGVVYRTDIDDDACKLATNKVGNDADKKPGGCSNYRVEISNQGISVQSL